MYDLKWIRENAEAFDEGRARRGLGALSPEILALDDTRRAAIAKLQAVQERRNAASKEVGEAMKAKDIARAEALKAEVATLKVNFSELELEEKNAIAALETLLLEIPNLPLDTVPLGKDENDNVELRVVGEKPTFGFKPKEHFEIGEALGLMDFETAAKLSGARFVVNKGPLARLERALSQFMLDLHTETHGYTEVNPPILVRDEAMFGTAQLPKFREDQFLVIRENVEAEVGQNLWLIPTAEVPLTNLVRESILDEAVLPIRVTASTPCFRAEAGAAGRDTRGMIRQHQFTKVELVSITTPEQSEAEHERMLSCAEEVLKRLGLAYRVMTLCTGDMGFASQKTYDIEVWLPGQDRYREISSCSVCGDFQARRLNARYRPAGAKATRFVHTLNGSGVAVGRALVAVLENYQEEDGSVRVPDVLKPYMGGVTRLSRAS
ncbi:MAG: serine--tRNA ligase [Beijerinckiaceae bacterium]|nr:serine--tRNA ligase [Beijerinckiaceae bacterium]